MPDGGTGTGGAPSTPPVDALSVERECIRHSHQNLIGVFFAVPVGGAILLYVLKDEIGSTYILAWFVLSLLWAVIRFWFYVAFRRHARGAFDPVFWGGLQSFLTITAGFIWGALPLVAYPPDSLSEQMFTALMIGGMAAGGTFAYAAMPRTAQAFLAASLFPIAAVNLAKGSVEHFPVGIMLTIYYLMLVIITRNNARTVRSAITLALENAALAGEMGKARDAAESAADKLRVEVIDREKAKNELNSIMEAQPDILYVIDPRGALIKWNTALQQLCGLPPERMKGRPAAEFVCEEDRPVVYEGIREVFEKGIASIEVRFIRHDGVLVPHLCNGAVWRNRDGEPLGFIGVGKDISALKKAAQVIRESEERYRLISEASFEGIVINIDGKVVDCNSAFARMFGYTPDEIIGKIPLDLSPPESHAIIMDHIRRESEEVYDVAARKKDGTLFNIEMRGRSILYHGVKARITAMRDITGRVKAEQAIRESEERLRATFDNSEIGMAFVNTEGKLERVNAALCRIYGYGEQEVIGRSFQEFTHPDDLQIGVEWLQKVARNEAKKLQVEKRYIREDGGVIWCSVAASLIRDAQGKPLHLFSTVIDITERKRAEDELRESEENLRKAQEIAHVGNWHWDILNNTLRWSDEIYRIFGRAPQEFGATYEAFLSYVHPDDRAYVQQRVNDAIAKKSLYDINHRIVLADGGVRIVHEVGEVAYDATGLAVSMVGVVQDITDLKRAEQALRKNSQLLDAIVENIPNMIFLKRASDLRFELFNRAGEALLGHNRAELLGRNDYDFFPKEQADFFVAKDRETLEKSDVTDIPEEPIQTPSGTRILHTKKLALRDGRGRPEYLLGISEDITVRKAAEDELRKAKEVAEEATRLKDKFISLVSHDLKTPLTSMIGYLKLVRNDNAEPPSSGVKMILDRAMESGDAMVHLIEDLLTISRFKTGQLKLNRQFFDAEILGSMMAGNYSFLAEQKGIGLENAVPAKYRVYGDKALLAEAVQNLVTNAIKFCKSGDRITIFAGEAGASTIFVRDTGPGIPPNLLKDIFRFEKKTSTTGTAGETGTGFGLPLVKEIMQLHAGELAVESEPGKGCLFSLKLPHVRPRILLVDDEKNFRLLQAQRLQTLNADIVEAENGEEALNQIAGGRIDLVITDIQMPVMGGLELLKRIKDAPGTKDIPVIVMSGEFGMEVRDTIFKLGGEDFLTKTVDKADLFPRVRRFIG